MKKTSAICFATLSLLLTNSTAFADQNTAMKSGCLGCHKADAKLVGPSFKDIAGKYAGQGEIVGQLATTVKSGSPGGKWGQVPMPASPAPIEDIKTVIAWMLTH